VTATPSLLVSLAAKPNDHIRLIFPIRDSVIFTTGRHKFDIFLNRKEKPVRQQQILSNFLSCRSGWIPARAEASCPLTNQLVEWNYAQRCLFFRKYKH
jgi:hypothetical protein